MKTPRQYVNATGAKKDMTMNEQAESTAPGGKLRGLEFETDADLLEARERAEDMARATDLPTILLRNGLRGYVVAELFRPTNLPHENLYLTVEGAIALLNRSAGQANLMSNAALPKLVRLKLDMIVTTATCTAGNA